MATKALSVVGNLVVHENELINFTKTDYNNVAIYLLGEDIFTLRPDATLVNYGEIIGVDTMIDHPELILIRPGESFWINNVIKNYGLMSVSSSHGDAKGVFSSSWSPSFLNVGKLLVLAPEGHAMGVGSWEGIVADWPYFIENSGSIEAHGAKAQGIYTTYGNIINSGSILAKSSIAAAGLYSNYFQVLNTGTIVAEDNNTTNDSIGVCISSVGANSARNGSLITNWGTISGDASVLESADASVATTVHNFGTLNGRVDLGGGDDTVLNNGVLNGTALMGAGVDYYDGRMGSLTGPIDGGDGADILLGGLGDEVILGGAGEDMLSGGAGNDRLTGGDGGDVFVFASNDGADQIVDFDPAQDRFSLGGQRFLNATVEATGTLLEYANGSILVNTVKTLTLEQWNARVIEVILGTSGNDVLLGSSGNDVFIGGAGTDTASWSNAAKGVTVALTTAAQETGAGLDQLNSIENLSGSRYADHLTGDAANNVLWGADGDDVLAGLAGEDVIDGGLGDDVIDGGPAIDVVDYSKAAAGVTVDLTLKTQVTVMGVDSLISIEGVIGSAFADTLKGARLQGGAGADRLEGVAGDNLLLGGEGDDRLTGAGGRDTLNGDAGDDVLVGDAERDLMDGGAGDDILIGGAGDDTLTGGSGADVFRYLSIAESKEGGLNFGDHIRDLETNVDKIDLSNFKVSNFVIKQDVGAIAVRATTADGVITILSTTLFKGGDLILNLTEKSPAAVKVGISNILRESLFTASADALAADLSTRWSSGAITGDQMIREIVQAGSATTSVATMSYQFFTGKVPTAAGMDYLVSPVGLTAVNGLNGAYYKSFSMENRYINFAVNLGKEGEGKALFATKYGALSLFDATREAYHTIFGGTPTDAKVHELIDGRLDYFKAYGGDGLDGQGTKAAMVGWLLAEAVKADVGLYARANDALLIDLADGAALAVDLVGTYGKAEFNYAG